METLNKQAALQSAQILREKLLECFRCNYPIEPHQKNVGIENYPEHEECFPYDFDLHGIDSTVDKWMD